MFHPRQLLFLVGTSLLAASSAYAQTNLFWDVNGDTTTATGGTGTWSTTSTWRSGSSTGTLGDWTDGDIAVFGGTAGTVTLSAPVSAAGLTFSTTGYTITGSTLTLTGIPVISAAVTTSTISSDIAGTNGFEKTGAGTLILSGTNNTYSGTTTISAGTLQGIKSTTGGASPFGTSTIQLNAGTLSSVTSSATDSTETFTFGNNVNVGGDATINFTRVGGVGSNKTHAYGNLSIGSNTLSLTASGINHTLGFTGAILTGNAIINNGTNATVNMGAITETGGARNLTKQGGATLRLTGTNTYTGTTTISGGTLEVQGSIASSSGIVNNATLVFNSGSAQSYSNVISGSGNVTIYGATLSLLGLNSYTGTTTIGSTGSATSGTVIVNTLNNYNQNSSLGAAGSGDIIFAKLAVNNLIYVGSGSTTNRTIRHEADVSNRNNGSGIYNNGTGAFIFNGSTFNTPFVQSGNGGRTTVFNLGGTYSGSANEIRGVIANNDATSLIAITKVGSGTWTLGGSNTYTGATTLNAGTLKLNYDTGASGTNTSKLADTNGILALNGGTLELAGGSHAEVVTSTTLNNGTTFIRQTGGGSSTLSMGVITYTGGALDFSAAGIANVSTSAVTNGILSSAAGTARVTVGGADWAAKDGSNNVIAYTGYDTTFAGGATTANVNYSINGSQGVDGVVTLTGNRGAASNTFKITTSGANQAMALGANQLSLGSMLFAGANNYSITNTTGRINTAFLLHNYGAGTLTLGATNGLITQFGTGKTILSGNNASNVGINIFGGTVQFSNNLQIGTNTGVQAIALNNGTLLADTTSADIALNNGGLNSRTVTLGAGGGTLDVIGGGMLTVSGVISDTAGQFPTLTIGSGSSNGTIALTGTNTYTGRTVISGGTLSVGTIGNGGVAGNLGQASNVAYNIVFDGGTLLYTGANATSDRAFTINAGKTANIHTTNNLSLAGATGIATTGALTKTGAGTLTLTGTNTYTGATNVSNGTLIVNGSISNSSLTTVASGATIAGSGTIGALTVSSGGFINPGNSPGTLDTGNFIQAGLYTAEITGLTPDTQHDQINVTGTVNIAGGSLTALFSAGTYAANDLIFILLNDGTDAITGTYTGLAQGTTVTSYGGFDWQISYTANNTGAGTGTFTGGNDIALIAVIPEPSVVLLSSLGVLLLFRRKR